MNVQIKEVLKIEGNSNLHDLGVWIILLDVKPFLMLDQLSQIILAIMSRNVRNLYNLFK